MITDTTSLGNIKNFNRHFCKDGKIVFELDFELNDQAEHGPYTKTTLYALGRDDTIEYAIQHLVKSVIGAILEYHNEQMESTKEEDPCTFKPV